MWAMVKRVFLFAVVNILIMVTLSTVFTIAAPYLGLQSGAESTIYVFYALIGFGGAFISLAMSRMMAKWMMGVRVIDPNTMDPTERALVQSVHNMARQARLPAMPEVGIYDSPEVNAFATGPTKARALVAVSTGLLHHMDKDAVDGVLGHEVAHIANGDMVTMTLLQGLINTMVLIVARIVSGIVASNAEERSREIIRHLTFIGLQIVLSLLGSLVVSYFSRLREFRADAGGARIAGRDRMIAGLKSLRDVYGHVDENQQSVATLKISGHASGFLALFSTHPPLEERIRRLESYTM